VGIPKAKNARMLRIITLHTQFGPPQRKVREVNILFKGKQLLCVKVNLFLEHQIPKTPGLPCGKCVIAKKKAQSR